MRILWTVNILFPEAKALLEKKPSTLASSGGWLIGAAEALAARKDIQLHIACPAKVDSLQVLQGERIRYYLFPVIARSGEPFFGDYPPLDAVFKEIIRQVRPELIDIHGTEYAHSLSCLRTSAGIPTVVTLQGFIHAVAEHYRDGIDDWTLYTHELFHRGSIRQEQKGYFLRGIVEKRWLRQVTHFIGRTEWDRRTVLSLNPDARYHICQETLREPFYTGRWTWESCEKHSIFASQGSYPLKGLHQLLKALPAVLKQYPDAVLYVGGGNIVEGRHPGHYGRILRSMIRRWKLEEKVRFTGNLDAEEMKRRYLRSNVFVCPSSNENSPNSLGEAQILGVPCIASRVGGIPSMIPNGQCGILYPFEDTKALAARICEVFAQGAAFDNGPMQKMARQRHDPESNTETLLGIYREVVKDERQREKHYLMVALDAAYTAPGIVFKSLIRSLAQDHRITLMSQTVDPAILTDHIRLIPLKDGVEDWRKAEKKWRRLAHNPRDERWAEKTLQRHREEILKERYDALIVLCSNGYYSSLNLGSKLRDLLYRPYIIYSVDGMPSPLPWLGGDRQLHGNISAELNRLCSRTDLFLLSNPRMTEYQKGILTDFKGEWDYLFTPYRELPKGFRREKHEGFNILYAGSLYGLRKIDGLVEAFRRFLKEKEDARLTFVGDIPKYYQEFDRELVKAGKLRFLPATDEINHYYANADCLIDIAADIPDDVFLSSKVICYLPYEIPVIAISGENSPVSQIMGGVGSILQCRNQADEILSALRSALTVDDFSDRRELLDRFNADNLATRFKTLINNFS